MKIKKNNTHSSFNGDWGLGIGDWGLGIGDWAQSPIPNPQSPIPNPHYQKENFMKLFLIFNV
jgi:hypothetical protein